MTLTLTMLRFCLHHLSYVCDRYAAVATFLLLGVKIVQLQEEKLNSVYLPCLAYIYLISSFLYFSLPTLLPSSLLISSCEISHLLSLHIQHEPSLLPVLHNLSSLVEVVLAVGLLFSQSPLPYCGRRGCTWVRSVK